MNQFYHNSAKKATIGLSLAIFLFFVLAGPVGAKIPNDPGYQAPIWEQIGAPAAWDYGVGSRQVVVAVIDTGADIWHDDLRENIWQNPYEIPDNGLDDDKNGYIDDTHGWNFLENNNDVRTSIFDENGDAKAIHHGTIISGLVGAVGDNSRDGTGLNWRVQLMPLRAVNSQGEGSFYQVAEAVKYAVSNGAAVISLSLVSDINNDYLKAVLRRAYEQGVVIVAAAGNEKVKGIGNLDKYPLFPICYDKDADANWIIGVSSVDSGERLSYFANFGRCVDILAPGEGIYSTERYAPLFGYPDTFGGAWKGTSFSAPQVAGAAALIKSIRPDWGAREIIDNLLNNADNVDAVNSIFLGRLGRGRLNIGRAAAVAAGGNPRGLSLPYVYFFNQGEIYRYNLKGKFMELMAVIREADIKSMAVADLNRDRQWEIILLIQRGPFHYIKLLKANGEFWREFAMDGTPFPSSITVGKVEARLDSNEHSHILIEQFDSKGSKTQFIEYSTDGQKLGTSQVSGRIVNWEVLNGGNLLLAQMAKSTLLLREIDMEGVEKRAEKINGVKFMHDLKVVNSAAGGTASKVIFLVQRGKKLTQYVMDWGTAGLKKDNIFSPKETAKWRLLVGDIDEDRLLDIGRFHLEGGVFPVYNLQGRLVRNIRMPPISGGVD